jgi:hypothetical protein
MPESVSVSYLSALTGKDRRTITSRIAALPFEDGEKGAHLYNSEDALAVIYGRDSDGMGLEEARAFQAVENAELARVRREELQKTRIPLHIPLAENERATASVAGILKNSLGKVLSREIVEEILGEFRAIPARLKW